MLVSGSNKRIFGVDTHAGIAITGFTADGRQLVHRARDEASSYLDNYGIRIVPSVLASRLALYVHYFTTHGSLRPFGSASLIAAYDEDTKTPELYLIEPSGLYYRYYGCAAGKGAQAAKTELEKIISKSSEQGLTCREAIKELSNM